MQITNRIHKLYDGLTNKERAMLVISHVVNGQREEIDKILSTIPRKNYVCTDIEYDHWYDAIWDMATKYQTEHWRLRAFQYEAFFASWAWEKLKDDEKADKCAENFLGGFKYLFSLDSALAVVCKKYGVDVSLVMKLSGTESYEAFRHSDFQADENISAKYINMLSRQFVRVDADQT